MKKLLFALFLIFAPAPAHAAYSLITAGHGCTTAAGTSGSLDTTGGDIIFFLCESYTGGTACTVSDSKSNTWNTAPPTTQTAAGLTRLQLYYAKNANVGTSHTFTVSSASYATSCVAAFSGSDTSSPYDQEAGSTVASGMTVTPGSVTPTTDNQIVISGMAGNFNNTLSVDSGFTIIDQIQYVPFFSTALSYKIQTTAAAVNPVWTWVTSGDAAALNATFKSSGGAAPAPKRLMTLGAGEGQ